MSDYARQQDFNAATGTTIFGSDVDSEFNALLTAVNSKVDESREGSANGIATLGAGALIPVGTSGLPTTGGGQVPESSVTTLGAVELANTAEAQALTDALRVLTPDSLDDVLVANGGFAKDLQAMAAPGTDTIFGYDLSGTAAIGYTVGAGLETALTVLQIDDTVVSGNGVTATLGVFALDFLGLELLVDPNVDALYGWDDTAGTSVWFQALDGLEFTNATGSIGIVDVAAGAAQPVDILAGVFTFDLSSITEITGPGLDQAADGFLVNDAGTLKVLPIDQSGIKVVNATDAIQTFTFPDANTMQVLDSTTTRAWTVPPNSTTAFEIGTVILLQAISTADITVTASTGVTLTSIWNTAGTTATSDTVTAGGRGALIKVATDEWTISGDVAD